MGISYEMNWYLVVGSENEITRTHDNEYEVIKNDKRIYPVGAPIPYIIKNIGCVAMIEIVSFEVSKNATKITFKILDLYKNDKTTLKHYYDMYLSMK